MPVNGDVRERSGGERRAKQGHRAVVPSVLGQHREQRVKITAPDFGRTGKRRRHLDHAPRRRHQQVVDPVDELSGLRVSVLVGR